MKITPDLIPHNSFHKGAWLLSLEKPDWYYFLPKKNTDTINNKGFLKTVDRPLRSLVRYLHRKGIKTTPSCSGHHFSERNLEKIYDNLEQDKAAIQDGGLQLKDVETGKIYLFSDKNYSLPWSRTEFIDQLTIYQQKGVIGIKLGNSKKAKRELLKLSIRGAIVEEEDNIIFIFAKGENGNNTSIWKKVTKAVKKIL
jgi:hypothetical protein